MRPTPQTPSPAPPSTRRAVSLATLLALALSCAASATPDQASLDARDKERMTQWWRLFLTDDAGWPEAKARWLAQERHVRVQLFYNLLGVMIKDYADDLQASGSRVSGAAGQSANAAPRRLWRRAQTGLVEIGKEAVPYLVHLLRKDPQIREVSGETLVRIGAEGLDALAKVQADEDVSFRLGVVQALGCYGRSSSRTLADRARDHLLRLLEADQEFSVRAESAEALGRFPSSEAEEALARAAKVDPDPFVRIKAAEAMLELESWHRIPEVLSVMRTCVSQDDLSGVRQLANALRKLTGEKLGNDPDQWQAWWRTQGSRKPQERP